MLMHLWTSAPAPYEYVEVMLCREFGVLPSRLRDEPADNVANVLAVMEAEAKVRKARR